MNIKLLACLAFAGSLTLHASEAPAPAPASTPASAAKPAAPADSATVASSAALTSQVQALVTKISAKLQKGLRTESDYTDELTAFDALLAAHKDEKTDAVAQAQYFKGLLYIQFLNEPAKGLAVFKQIAQDYPNTHTGAEIAKMVPQLEAQMTALAGRATAMAAANQAQKDLVVGKVFPEFALPSGAVMGIDGKPLSIAQYRGKIVLIDFWATWCGPCMGEMPNVIAAYDKYHSRGFDIIGVSLDNPTGQSTLPAFLKDHKMPWRQFCDGKYWQNELAVKYGIESIPASYLLDATGKIIAVSPRGAALAPAIEAALAAAGANKS